MQGVQTRDDQVSVEQDQLPHPVGRAQEEGEEHSGLRHVPQVFLPETRLIL